MISTIYALSVLICALLLYAETKTAGHKLYDYEDIVVLIVICILPVLNTLVAIVAIWEFLTSPRK